MKHIFYIHAEKGRKMEIEIGERQTLISLWKQPISWVSKAISILPNSQFQLLVQYLFRYQFLIQKKTQKRAQVKEIHLQWILYCCLKINEIRWCFLFWNFLVYKYWQNSNFDVQNVQKTHQFRLNSELSQWSTEQWKKKTKLWRKKHSNGLWRA